MPAGGETGQQGEPVQPAIRCETDEAGGDTPATGRGGAMRKGLVIVGGLLVLAGITFGLQGMGVLGGSAMSGKTLWAVLGPVIGVVGVVLVARGLRVSDRHRQ